MATFENNGLSNVFENFGLNSWTILRGVGLHMYAPIGSLDLDQSDGSNLSRNPRCCPPPSNSLFLSFLKEIEGSRKRL
jgi:hypothetical protein